MTSRIQVCKAKHIIQQNIDNTTTGRRQIRILQIASKLKVVLKSWGSLSSITPLSYPLPQSITPLPLSWGLS